MRMSTLTKIQNELKLLADPKQAQNLQRFFKTGKGEYAEGDIFYGIKVPVTRGIAKKFGREVTLKEAEELLHSKIHEERLCALLILIQKFESKEITPEEQKEIFDFYLANTKYINNWDLVDLSSHEIAGAYLFSHPKERKLLKKLATSELLWDKRIAMVSCYHFIYRKEFSEPLMVAELLQKDGHDLMHKAVGWMLREIGKRDLGVLEDFLKKHYKQMPRTMLRYAIEKFPEAKRKKYLKGLV
ncbi:DNA alkylation repair enzyme [uncultured archaeon]|nr:DNA alkylation repair enzyme [uncultured archaeon]